MTSSASTSTAGIKTPKDIEGKKIGVALYTMTAAIFVRGLLSDEYGVDFSSCKWIQGAINTAGSHGDPHVLPLLKQPNLIQGPPTSRSTKCWLRATSP